MNRIRLFHTWLSISVLGIIFIFRSFDIKLLLSITTQPRVITEKSFSLVEITSYIPLCENVEESTKGHWELKKDITRHEIEERKRVDTENRLAMDWPAHLFRNDSRCGKEYPLPGYRLQSQCNPEGLTPCCNQASGRCGIDITFCECSVCTDLRTMIPAELAVWKPNTCRLEYFYHKDACQLLNKYKIHLMFMDDFLEGSIPVNSTDEHRKLCRGEQQITNKKCSVEVVAKSTEELSMVCNGENIKVDLVQDYHRTLIPEVSEKLNSLLEKEDAWIICGVGLHYLLDFPLIKTEYLDKIWSKLRTSKNGWPKILWVGIHGTFGFLRMSTGPINSKVEAFNKKVHEYWSNRNITVVETFNMSKDLNSYDGRHYGIGFNKLKVQVLLNHLYHYYR